MNAFFDSLRDSRFDRFNFLSTLLDRLDLDDFLECFDFSVFVGLLDRDLDFRDSLCLDLVILGDFRRTGDLEMELEYKNA